MAYPLFIVAGVSGSGKTTTAPLVRDFLGTSYNVYDMDWLVVGQDFQSACNNWIRVAYLNSLSGNKTVLFGAIPSPYNIEICDHINYFDPIHYLLLHCNSSTREIRLSSRGGWTPEAIQQTNIDANQLFTDYLAAQLPIIDTSTTASSIVATQIKNWVLLDRPRAGAVD